MKGVYTMKNNKYSVKIANAVKDFLVYDDWKFCFDEDLGVFWFVLCVKSTIKEIDYMIQVHDNDYVVYAFSPIGADEDNRDMMLKMAEFVCRVNDGLVNGNFELNMDDGSINYKTYVDCGGGMTPSRVVVRNSIYCCASMFDQYAPGILDIILGDSEAKDAVDECIIKLLIRDEETSRMLDQLAERFEITPDVLTGLEDAAEDEEEIDEPIRMNLFPRGDE